MEIHQPKNQKGIILRLSRLLRGYHLCQQLIQTIQTIENIKNDVIITVRVLAKISGKSLSINTVLYYST